MTDSLMARRVTIYQARHLFLAGRTILVSERGHLESIPVGPSTTRHTRDTITWYELVAQVKEWRARYPRQRFYVVDEDPAPRVPRHSEAVRDARLSGQSAGWDHANYVAAYGPTPHTSTPAGLDDEIALVWRAGYLEGIEQFQDEQDDD